MRYLTSTPDPRDSALDLPYMPQLDSLRACAIAGVLVTHLYGLKRLPLSLGRFDWARLGVSLFFVLSGYLISTILLRYRDAAEASAQPKRRWVWIFYARRALRIFPLYYLVVCVAFALGLSPVREAIVWLMTYTTNIYIATHWNWIGPMGHFWTLAVEEQFYLVWPCLVMFLPRRWLLPVTLAGIAAAPLVRAFLLVTYPDDVLTGPAYTLTHTAAQLDTLGAGALLAIATQSVVSRQRTHQLLSRAILPACLAASAVLHLLLVLKISKSLHVVLFDLCAAGVLVWVVASAAQGFSGLPGMVLRWRPLVYVGRISYGAYVYHNFVPAVLASVGVAFEHRSVSFLVSSCITLTLASISWHVFERPLNRFKRRLAPSPRVAPAMSVRGAHA